MRFVSFNVNSIRARMHQLQAVVDRHSPDFIGLQETRVADHEFPLQQVESMGYHVQFHGQKTHYGVALLSRLEPRSVWKGFHHENPESQARLVGCDFLTRQDRVLTVINGYFPQGENRSHPVKFNGKRAFYADLLAWLENHRQPDDLVVVMGDMNVAPLDRDIGIGEENRKRWLRDGKTGFLPEEREWVQALMDWGMIDTFRALYPDRNDVFSWFDYRSRGFEQEPKRGLRIDLILASTGLTRSIRNAGIDYDIRAMEKPSDHCPVWTEIVF